MTAQAAGTTSKRKEYRQHSKSTLLRATQVLFDERRTLIAREASRWRRRLALAALLAFALGAAAGHLLTGGPDFRTLLSLTKAGTGRPPGPPGR